MIDIPETTDIPMLTSRAELMPTDEDALTDELDWLFDNIEIVDTYVSQDLVQYPIDTAVYDLYINGVQHLPF